MTARKWKPMCMSGSLDKRITIVQRASTTDEYGQPNETWSAVKTIWAGIFPVTEHLYKEFLAGLAEQSSITHRIYVRDGAGIKPTMRVQYDGREFEIITITNEAEAGRKYIINAKEVFKDG